MAGLALVALGLLAPRLADPRWRLGAAAALALLAWAVIMALMPACAAGAGDDPLLRAIHPDGFGFAAAGIRQSAGAWVAAAGLGATGLAAFAVSLARRAAPVRDRQDDISAHAAQAALLLAAGVAGALLGGLANLSVAAFGAALAVPLLARAVLAVLGRRWPARLGLSLAAIGLVWQTLGLALDLARGRPAAVMARAHAAIGAGCQAARTLDQIDRLAPGTVAAPPELGGHLLGATRHRVLAAPVAAAQAGNRAWYDLILAAPDTARYQAALWAVDYVLLCPESLADLPVPLPPRSLAARLRAGDAPDWMEPVLILGSRARMWRVLPVAASAR
ncbi:hypothetical protein GVO57_04635 [Sphingomonas changnyeongensis]|uniref:Uncharacterized protein n=1 Tax=Sphingomonas changnyeongensis TaxID=2698679 RepID=A0A7Z2S5D5_9SPHN|nr:hypothetical protein [Sphingomonas changnyeongensis]QHL90253.1 hypothetical protein GVO57_04635 [Sphingomonas changnyeongensis]